MDWVFIVVGITRFVSVQEENFPRFCARIGTMNRCASQRRGPDRGSATRSLLGSWRERCPPPCSAGRLTLRAKQGSTQWSKFSNRQAANHFMRPVILSVLLVAGASFARAEDITTTERKVFKNAEVI